MSTEDEVRKALEQFYAALNRMLIGDPGSLPDIWFHNPTVTAMHPIGGRQVGWDEVRTWFEKVSKIASEGQVTLGDQAIQVAGDVAYELGIESGHATMAGELVAIDQRVTNIYRREAGVWKIVHHHTDISPAMVGVVSRL